MSTGESSNATSSMRMRTRSEILTPVNSRVSMSTMSLAPATGPHHLESSSLKLAEAESTAEKKKPHERPHSNGQYRKTYPDNKLRRGVRLFTIRHQGSPRSSSDHGVEDTPERIAGQHNDGSALVELGQPDLAMTWCRRHHRPSGHSASQSVLSVRSAHSA